MASLLKQRVAKKDASVAHFEPGVSTYDGHSVVVRTTPVCWGIPFDEVMFSKAARSLLMERAMPWDDLITAENTYLAEARQKIHNQFLEFGLCDWLLMRDSDVCAPPDYVARLLAHHKADPAKRVLSGYYRMKGEPYEPVVYHYRGDKTNFKNVPIAWWKVYRVDEVKPTGLEEVDGAGAGAWLIHRDVIKAIGPDPFDMHAGGEDLQLCRLITKAGYKMFVDWSLRLAHVGVGTV